MERAEIASALRRSLGNADAYDCYLKGQAQLAVLSVEGIDRAFDLFSKAISLDGDLVSAYGALMLCHALRVSFGMAKDLGREQSEVSRLWKIVAQAGNDDGRALTSAGWAVAHVLRDFPAAKRLIDRAVEVNPNLASAWTNSGWVNIWGGYPEVAVEQLTRAQRLDPISIGVSYFGAPSYFSAMAHAYFFLDKHEQALDQAQQLLHRNPNNHAVLRIGTTSAGFLGRVDVAEQLAARLQVVDPAFSVHRLSEYLGPYQRPEFAKKYAEGLRRAGLP